MHCCINIVLILCRTSNNWSDDDDVDVDDDDDDDDDDVMLSGTELGTISVTGSQGAARYSSNSSVIAVDQASGVVTLRQPLDYAVSASLHSVKTTSPVIFIT